MKYIFTNKKKENDKEDKPEGEESIKTELSEIAIFLIYSFLAVIFALLSVIFNPQNTLDADKWFIGLGFMIFFVLVDLIFFYLFHRVNDQKAFTEICVNVLCLTGMFFLISIILNSLWFKGIFWDISYFASKEAFFCSNITNSIITCQTTIILASYLVKKF